MAYSYSYQSDDQSRVSNLLWPYLQKAYQSYNTGDNLWKATDTRDYMPNVSDYIAGGENWKNAYSQIAPSYTDTYKDLYNQSLNKLSNAGTAGSPYGGGSGAAAETLGDLTSKWANQINSSVTQNIQPTLEKAYGVEASAGQDTANEQRDMNEYIWKILPSLYTSAYPETVSEGSTSSSGK